MSSRWRSLWKKCTEFIYASCSDTALRRSVSTSLSSSAFLFIASTLLSSDLWGIIWHWKDLMIGGNLENDPSHHCTHTWLYKSAFFPPLMSEPPHVYFPDVFIPWPVSVATSQGQEREELCHGLCAPDEGGWDSSTGWAAWPYSLQGQNQNRTFAGRKTSLTPNLQDNSILQMNSRSSPEAFRLIQM